jgi:hypothetical protein
MKFGCRLIILFKRKLLFKKRGPFSWAMVRPFFQKAEYEKFANTFGFLNTMHMVLV